jgi:AraC-like DNA-binding protein
LVLVRPGEWHWYGPGPGACWDEAFCAFGGPVFDLAVRHGALGARRVVAVGDPAQVAGHLERLRVAAPPTSAEAQDAEALELLGMLQLALAPTPTPTLASGWLAHSMQRLEADGGEDLEAVAAAVGLTYQTWRRRFREQVGVAPARYRREARLRASAALLTMTSLSGTGFVDDRHLSRHFVRVYGLTPGRFRQQHPTSRPGLWC